jgi:hypothetical protein
MTLLRLKNFSLLFLAATVCGGCAAVGSIIYKTQGPGKVDAKYVLPKEPTLILVENRANPAESEFDADEIAREMGSELKKQKDGPPLIDPDKLGGVRDADPDKFRTMAITALGRAVGAKQVVYVNLLESGVQGDASQTSIHGKATARVRVINVEDGQTLWPMDSTGGGWEVSVEIPYSSNTDRDTIAAMHTAIINQLSDSIAKLFYAWRPEDEHEGDTAG